MAFFLLAQYSKAGRLEAAALIEEMRGQVYRKPSAFVHERCKDVRHRLAPEGVKYKGKGSYAADDPRLNR